LKRELSTIFSHKSFSAIEFVDVLNNPQQKKRKLDAPSVLSYVDSAIKADYIILKPLPLSCHISIE